MLQHVPNSRRLPTVTSIESKHECAIATKRGGLCDVGCIVSGSDGVVLRKERDGSLVTYAVSRNISGEGWSEIAVDGRGNAYVAWQKE